MTEMIDMTEDTDPYATTTDEGVELLAGAPWKRMVVMGDSVSAGIREAVPGYQDLSWVDRISAVLGRIHPDFAELRLARRDLTLPEIKATQLRAALDFEPDLVFLTGGGNDFLRPGFDPGSVRDELNGIVSACRGVGADVLTIGMLDITQAGLVSEKYAAMLSKATRLVASITEEVSDEHGAVYVRFTDHPLSSDAGIYCSDRMHLNARGQAFVATEKMHALARCLATRAATA